jgi:hypothetical protein
MSLGKAPGARFEVSIDGVPRSHPDRKEIAIVAAEQLMLKYPKQCRRDEGPAKRRGDCDWLQERPAAALMFNVSDD